MSILLAPYNDSMRLGMGFNSYTQTMCTDNAVKVTRQDTIRSDNPSQVVTYSSKVVENLSEVVGSMNISYSSSIRKGTVEVAGSSNSINEDKIKQSDLNAVVSVKVVNQTTIINEDCEFQPLPNVVPGSKDFDDAFGDCYISGFIEGGDFNGIISMRVMDRSKVDTVSKAIKKSLSSGSGKDFTLDMDAFTRDSTMSNAVNNTETTISVSWMGGGQIKDPSTKWELDSVFASAAAFPSQVAKCPQRTWAILTKYKANRSFQAKLSRVLFSPLEYDAVASYTQELFENFMEYKQLMKLVQDMMNNPSNYQAQSAKHNSITLEIRTLVAVRTAMRQEMNKIVAAVDVLSRDPNSLKRDANSQTMPNDALVQAIIKEALGSDDTQPQQLSSTESSSSFSVQQAPVADLTVSTTSSDGVNAPTPASSNAENQGTGLAAAPIQHSQPREQIKFDYSKLMAPEIWSDLLPLPVKATAIDPVGATAMSSAMSHQWAVAPDGDEAVKQMADARMPKLTILAAACGLFDITDSLQSLVGSDQTLSLKGSKFLELVTDSAASRTLMPFSKEVGFIYQYPDKPMRLLTVKNPESSDKDRDFHVTPDSTDTTVTPSAWNTDTWSISAVTWAAKCFNDNQKVMNTIQDRIRSSYNGGQGQRTVTFDNDLMGEDPWPGNGKLGMIFYQAREGGRMHIAVAVETVSPAIMTENLGFRSLTDHLDLIKYQNLKNAPPPPTQPPPPTFDSIQWGSLNSNTDAKIPNSTVNAGAMATVTFTPAFKSAPVVLSGLRKLDMMNDPPVLNVAFDADYSSVSRNGFHAWARTHNGCRMWESAMSWLALPEKDYHAESGVVNTRWFNNATAAKIETKVQFKRPFSTTPKIYCWLTGVEMSKQNPSYFGVSTSIPGGDSSGFNLVIESWSTLNFDNVSVGWFAYDASEDGNRIQVIKNSLVPSYDVENFLMEGLPPISLSTMVQRQKLIEARAQNVPPAFKTERRAFVKPFTKTPAVFTAISRFDVNHTRNPRLKAFASDVDPRGLTLDGGAWGDTICHGLDMIVIAIEP